MTLTRFADIIHLSSTRTADPASAGIDRFVGLEHIEPENLHIRSWGNVADGTTFTNTFKRGQVLFGKRRAYQRKVAVADFDGVCSGDIYVFESKDPNLLLPELVPFILQSEGFYQYAVKTSAGSLSPRTNWTHLANYELNLPPVDEQRRIADLLWAADDYSTELNELLEKLEHIRKSFLFEKFNLLMSRKNQLVKVSQAGDVLMGRQLSPKYTKNISPKPYLRVANVFDGYLDLSDVKTMDFNETESQKFLLKFGDVLLNEGQSRELVGRNCIYRDEIPNCCFQNTLLRFRPKLTSSEYAHYFFQYCQYSGRFVEKSKQTTSIAHLGSGRFMEMSFPVPEPSEEKVIVDSLNEINKSLAQLRDTKQQTQVLKAEILKKELVDI